MNESRSSRIWSGPHNVHPVAINKGCRLTCTEHTTHEEATGSEQCLCVVWPQFNPVTISYICRHSSRVGERSVMNLGPEYRLAKLHADSINSYRGRTCCFYVEKITSLCTFAKIRRKRRLDLSCLSFCVELLRSHAGQILIKFST